MRYVRVSADDSGMRLDNFLLRTLRDVPKSRVYRIIRSGEVRINRGRAKPGTRLAEADEIRLPPVHQRERPGPGRPPDALIRRVERALMVETEDYLVFNKPPGLAVHAGTGLRFGLIEVLRSMRPGEFVELVHRLDRQTSGCLLVARSRAALDGLRAALNDVSSTKRYVAMVDGRWRHGSLEVDAPLSRDNERSGERMVAVDHHNGRTSLSWFEPTATFVDATLMSVSIRTGRTHQIRVHAAHKGHPVVGDDKYGDNAVATRWRRRGLRRMFLHAASLQIDYGGRRLVFEAPLTADLQRVLDDLECAE